MNTLESWLTEYPEANPDILTFIWTISNYNDNISPDMICEHYSAGFCYQFAIILFNLFKGQIMWLYQRSHIVFLAEDGICYDIWGVFTDYCEEELFTMDTLSPMALAGFTKLKGYDLQVIASGDVTDTICYLLYEDGTLSFNGKGELSADTLTNILDYCKCIGYKVTNIEVAKAITKTCI